MPRKKKRGAVREEASKGAKEAGKGKQEAGKGAQEAMGLDEISLACQEIQEEMERQQNKPKNRKKRAQEKTEDTVKSEAFKELLNGRKVESLFELDMADQPNSEVKTRLEELISIAVEVRLPLTLGLFVHSFLCTLWDNPPPPHTHTHSGPTDPN